MKYAIDEKRRERVSVRELFVLYGPDITKWPKVTCPGCHRKLQVQGAKNVPLLATGKNNEGQHRTPSNANPGFRHYNGEGKDCSYGYRDKGQFDDLTKTVADRSIGKTVRRDFFLPHNLERTVTILKHVLKENYSQKTLDGLIELFDRKNYWSWNFPAWSAAYAMLQQGEFNFKFKNGHRHLVRFLPDSHDNQKFLRMVWSGTSTEVKGYAPHPVSELVANRISRIRPEQLALKFG